MGFRSVGKSSLTIQFVDGQFVDSYDPTIENTFSKHIKIGGQEYELKLVDTAGQDEYDIFPSQYSVDIHGYVLVYSIASSKSFDVVQVIYDKLLDMTGKVSVPIILVGNKNDLEMQRVVPSQEGRKLADSWKVPFVEASAKENMSALRVFQSIIQEIEKAEGNGPPAQKQNSCVIS
ncbi:unnamed protein product [Notodromas monacha]|uniref:Rheb n=1 Tax=Notodromas monacha TaxID=399045 RepID=A0A7R9BIN2_9CRUS|nr:unnamed protein product [Notodromas monacha]CAG0914794.1 unnamed protein product [Notodromas monacha]